MSIYKNHCSEIMYCEKSSNTFRSQSLSYSHIFLLLCRYSQNHEATRVRTSLHIHDVTTLLRLSALVNANIRHLRMF
jgi:hypothetical protein